MDTPHQLARVGRQATLSPRIGKLLYVWRWNGSLIHVWALPFDEARGIATGSPFQVTRFDSASHRLGSTLSLGAVRVTQSDDAAQLVDTTGNIWMLDNVDR